MQIKVIQKAVLIMTTITAAYSSDARESFIQLENYALQTSPERTQVDPSLDKIYLEYWAIYKDAIWTATDPWFDERWTYDVFRGIDPALIVNDDFIVEQTNEVLIRDGDQIRVSRAYIVGMSYVGINLEQIVYFPELGGYYHNVPGVDGRFGEYLGNNFLEALSRIIRTRRDRDWKIELDYSGRKMNDHKYKKE